MFATGARPRSRSLATVNFAPSKAPCALHFNFTPHSLAIASPLSLTLHCHHIHSRDNCRAQQIYIAKVLVCWFGLFLPDPTLWIRGVSCGNDKLLDAGYPWECATG
jgi:hypothetical protein